MKNDRWKRREKKPTFRQRLDMFDFMTDQMNIIIVQRDIGQRNMRVVSFFNARYRIANRIRRLIERTEVRK